MKNDSLPAANVEKTEVLQAKLANFRERQRLSTANFGIHQKT
jgi:hypothetical protein